MNNYIVYENQTVYDVCANVYGHTNLVLDLAVLNNISVSEMLIAGQNIKLLPNGIDFLVKTALERRHIIPATGLNPTDLILIPPTGIGYMQIENNFKVS